MRGDVEVFWYPFRSHRRTSTGEVSLLLQSHVACVSKNSSKENVKGASQASHDLSKTRDVETSEPVRSTMKLRCCSVGKNRSAQSK